MPSYNITLKSGTDKSELAAAKQQVIDKGGKVTHEFSIIPGFTAEFPEDSVSTLETNDKITVEADGVVTTQ